MITVLSSDGKLQGYVTGVQFPCRMTGCNGLRIPTRWPDGRISYPCSKGMDQLPNGDWKIL